MQKLKVELDLKEVLKNLKISDLEVIIREASALITRRRTKDKKKVESELLYQLNHVYVPSQEHLDRFFKLVERRNLNIITPHELNELQILIDEEEAFQVKRIKILGKLGELWNMSILEVVKKLGLKPLESA